MAHIVLVEDNPHNRAVFQAALSKSGHTLAMAEDGAQALELVQSDPPDLLLLDLSIPKIDGWEVARTIRSSDNPKIANVPIVALTAHAMKGDRDRALAVGCNRYLSKPVSPRELRATVEEILGPADSRAA